MHDSRHTFNHRKKKDAKAVIDNLHILDRVIDRNEVVLESSGSPMTLWKYFPYGPKCSCELQTKCEICYGTKFINGYQRYGYFTYTYGETSIGYQDHFGAGISNLYLTQVPNQDGKAFVIRQGTSGIFETNWISVEKAKEHTFIRSMIYTPQGTSVLYSFTTDGVSYTPVLDLQEPVPVPEDSTAVKFRVTLMREQESIPSPALLLFQYRFRIRDNLSDYYKKFNTNEPAFLASKQVSTLNFKLAREGEVLDHVPRYWALPDVKIGSRDIGMFLKGNNKEKRFEFNDITTSEHGENSRVLHTAWDSRFIVHDNDLLGITYKLY